MVRNVVLLCLDTVRYDYYTEYASQLHDRAETTLEQCYAASRWSMPSHASLLTGQLAHKHGLHPRDTFSFEGLDVAETFLYSIPDHYTIGISANTYASSSFGFDTLFDEFEDYSPPALFQRGLKPQILRQQTGNSGTGRYTTFLKRSLTHNHPIRSLANGLWGLVPRKGDLSQSGLIPYSKHDGCETIAALARKRIATLDQPYFLFINAMDAHGPYEPLQQYDDSLHDVPHGWHTDNFDSERRESLAPFDYETDVEYYRQLYRASIDYLDRTFAPFVDDLVSKGDRETTVVIFSDHGENLGYKSDEYLVGHNSLSNAILHTPGDIINPPDSYPDRVTEPVSHLQLGDLIEAIAYDEEFPSIEQPAVPAEVPRAGGIDQDDDPGSPHLERMVRTLVTAEGRTEWDSLGACRRFERDKGFPESEHVVDNNSEVPNDALAFFEHTIETYLSALEGAPSIDESINPATEQRLEELGYL
jgi:arylsulfatase A-like enzyme